MELKLEASERQCYKGHVDTFDVEGTDPESVQWLGGWDLWCRTCSALVLDVDQRARRFGGPAEKDAIGYVVSVPVTLTIVERTPAERWPDVRRKVPEQRFWDGVLPKKREGDEGPEGGDGA